MELPQAWRRLGLEPTADRAVVRAAYLSRLRTVHPDLSPAADATEATVELVDAYESVLAALDAPQPTPVVPAPPREVVPIGLVDADTIGVALPPPETYRLAVEAAHRLGEVTFIEPSSGMVQVIVEFVEVPPCQLLLTLQGRATGVTEVFCSIESLDAGPPPPIDAVTRLLLDEMVAVGA